MKRIACGLLVALSVTSPASATGEILNKITPADQARLTNYAKSREGAIAEAKAGGEAKDVAEIERLLSSPEMEFQGFDLTGDWRCRVIKMGKTVPLVIYSWFRCRVTDDGSGWQLQKLSGSQKTKGRFFDDGPKRLTYLGVGYVNNSQPAAYGAGPATDQVGYALRSGQSQWRIEFPDPTYESRFDILEFQR